MKLTNEELDAILANAGLELAQPYAENGKYRKDEYLFTRCPSCGTEAHYRLKYILDKNGIGEKVCRACYWMHWYGDDRAVKNSAIKRMLDNGADIDNLIDQGAISAPDPLSISKAQKLAEENGFDLVDLLQGSRDGDDVLVIRCKSCGRQTAERPEDVAFGCTCGGKSLGISFGREAVSVLREATPVASGLYQDGTVRLLADSESPCLDWWDLEANGEIPGDLTCLSREERAWKCPDCGYRFVAPVYSMRTAPRCPNCTALRLKEFDMKWEALDKMTAADFPDLLVAWRDKRDPSTEAVTSGRLIHLECPRGHHPTQTLYSYLENGCMVCRGLATKALPDQSYLATTDPELAAEWVRPRDGGNYTPENVKDGSKRTIVWRCIACGHEWEATVRERQLRENNRCPSCGKVMGSLAWKYPQLAAEWSPSNPVSPWNIKPFGKIDFKPEWVCESNPEHVWAMSIALRVNKGRGCPICERENSGKGESNA